MGAERSEPWTGLNWKAAAGDECSHCRSCAVSENTLFHPASNSASHPGSCFLLYWYLPPHQILSLLFKSAAFRWIRHLFPAQVGPAHDNLPRLTVRWNAAIQLAEPSCSTFCLHLSTLWEHSQQSRAAERWRWDSQNDMTIKEDWGGYFFYHNGFAFVMESLKKAAGEERRLEIIVSERESGIEKERGRLTERGNITSAFINNCCVW